MIRTIPRYAFDRVLGEGDRCLRDSEGKIIAWGVGTTDEDWEALIKKNPGSYESVGYYDTEREMIV